MGKLKDLQARKKDIDIFGILLGIIIGFCIAYFIVSPSTLEGTGNDQETNGKVEGTVYLLECARSSSISNFDELKNRLDAEDLNCIFVDYTSYISCYVYISSDLNDAKNKKSEYEAKGFSLTIQSIYLLDLSNYVINDYEKIFYKEAIDNLLKSLKNETFIINPDYYIDPINIEVFSNLSVLQNIKNNKIKQYFELDTFKILIETLK